MLQHHGNELVRCFFFVDTNPDEPDTQAMITVLVVCGGLVAVVLLVSVTVVIMCHCSAPAKRSRKYAKLNETA